MLNRHLAIAAAAIATIAAVPAQAAGISDIAGFEGVRVWETTYAMETADFAAGDSRLSATLPGAALSYTGRDFGFFAGNENYDIFYSNADGSLNPDGSFLTIDGNCDVPWGCFNINEVALKISGNYELASSVVRAVYGNAPNSAGSAALAADGVFSTYTALGDTIGDYPDRRMSITLSFASAPPVPEPGTYALMSLGLIALACGVRRRRA